MLLRSLIEAGAEPTGFTTAAASKEKPQKHKVYHPVRKETSLNPPCVFPF
jgi:hypothetical protein